MLPNGHFKKLKDNLGIKKYLNGFISLNLGKVKSRIVVEEETIYK